MLFREENLSLPKGDSTKEGKKKWSRLKRNNLNT
jgi:hypothetical protein